MKPHYEKTVERIRECNSKYILAIQDETRLNYTSHLAKTEIGRIGKTGKTEQYGLIQHSTLCVTDKNEPLGLIDVQHFHPDEIDKSVHRHHRAVKEKQNVHWLDALDNMKERLGEMEKRIITVADREGDFYEFLHELVERDEGLVIRVKHNRYTGEEHRARGEKLRDLLDKAEICGEMEVSIQDVDTREMRRMWVKLKAIEITLPVPNKSKEEKCGYKEYRAIRINVVKAYNKEHEWILYTTLGIKTLEEIKEIVEIYRSRWHIEDYHKVLKTGYAVEEIYLHSSRQAIENLLVMASVSACRLYWIIYVGRVETDIKANELFEEFEWKAIYVYFGEKIPEESPVLSEVILKIARLGGYKGQKTSSPPGIKTMWIGYQQFTVAANMYRNMVEGRYTDVKQKS